MLERWGEEEGGAACLEGGGPVLFVDSVDFLNINFAVAVFVNCDAVFFRGMH